MSRSARRQRKMRAAAAASSRLVGAKFLRTPWNVSSFRADAPDLKGERVGCRACGLEDSCIRRVGAGHA